MEHLRPNQFLLRSKTGTYIHEVIPGTPATTKEIASFPAATSALFSDEGNVLALLYADRISFIDMTTLKECSTIARPNVSVFAFSPKGNYLVTWEGFKKEANLLVWNVKAGEIIGRYMQKNYDRDFWPTVQWTDDESFAVRLINDNVVILDGSTLEEVRKVPAPNVMSFSVAPCINSHHVAVFCGEKNGAPAGVSVFAIDANKANNTAIKTIRFFRADSVHYSWNRQGTAVLVRGSTEVDKTGASYYGESQLHLISLEPESPKSKEIRTAVDLDKEGPIHDMQWNPSGKDFIVIYGKQPAKSAIFDSTGRRVFSFGQAPRNKVLWGPHGRFIMLGGFGNLAGDVDFWEKNKQKRMGAMKCHGTIECGWSPCSRYFLTATTFPRLRVDNGYKLWTYYADRFAEVKCSKDHRLGEELYQATWRPAPLTAYPDRPISPHVKDRMRDLEEGKTPRPQTSDGAGAAPGGNGTAAAGAAEPKKTAYRPPALRGRATFTLHDDIEKAGKEARDTVTTSRSNLPPGAVDPEDDKLSKAALKNKKRNEKRKQEKQAELAPEPTPAPVPAAAKPAAAADSADSKEKQVRNLTKKLRQIDDLKAVRASGKPLNAEQLSKVAQEEEIRTQIAQLSV